MKEMKVDTAEVGRHLAVPAAPEPMAYLRQTLASELSAGARD